MTQQASKDSSRANEKDATAVVREALHMAGWFGRGDLDPRDVEGILRDVMDALGGSDLLVTLPGASEAV